jgi:glycosyltransferase involved in cell wall biosynthesis
VHPGWQLRIYGRGSLHGELTALIGRLGLTGRARLMGFSADLPQQLATGSVFAMSSRFEGFPMVLLEAMGCGLPPVSFDCPTGPGDIISSGRDGLLVPPRDVAALAAALEKMITDPALRRSAGLAAHRTVQQYSADRISQRWEDLFAELAAARGVTL